MLLAAYKGSVYRSGVLAVGFAEQLRQWRDRIEDLTQGDVAKALGVKQQTVSDWEAGKARPQRFRLRPLAEILEVPYDAVLYAFMEGDDPGGDIGELQRVIEVEPIDDLELAAHGVEFAELAKLDPEALAQLRDQARFFIQRAKDRRKADR